VDLFFNPLGFGKDEKSLKELKLKKRLPQDFPE
jgi:hypothetical protein